MKKLLILALAFIANNLSAQWVFKTIDNSFDEPYKVAYTNTDVKFLKLVPSEKGPLLILYCGYTCDTFPYIEINFLVAGKWEKYTVTGISGDDNKRKFYVTYIPFGSDIHKDFISATTVKIRVTDASCPGTEILEFSMSGSKAAYNFINN
jgi:hypothetical protein